jgi:NADPH-dependent 2,4-dienoyl-CoA reductase/sulfur reductase-like enzyme
MKRKIIVIGGLAAGPAAASKAKRIDPNSEVILLEQGEYISYGICEMPYYLSNKIQDLNDLILFTPEKLESEKKINVKTFHSVREIIHQKKEITVLDIRSEKLIKYDYDKLIIATGSVPIKHPAFNDEIINKFYFKSINDAIKLKKFFDYRNPKKAAIIGSGFIGIEIADALSSLGMEITILSNEELPLNKFEKETRKFAMDVLFKNKIKYIKYNEIKSIEYTDCTKYDGNVQSHNLKYISRINTDNFSVDTDLVIIAIGISPNTELARTSKISLGKYGGILIDSKMLTSNSNIYAAGDCCEIKNAITNRFTYLPFATTALKTGWAAGENASGGNSIIKGIIPVYTLSFFNAEIAHVGLLFEEAQENHFLAAKETIEGWETPKIYPDSEKIQIILTYDKKDNRILGAEIFGRKGAALRANILATAIYQKLTLKDLIQLDFVYHPQSTPLRDPILFCASSALKEIEK